MKKYFIACVLTVVSATCYPQQPLTLWYSKPAGVWTEALPVGNGRLGAMVFGGVQQELIQLNEATLWSGGPVGKNVNPGAFNNLEKARAALFGGDYAGADILVKNMQGVYSESYMPLGNLVIKQSLATDNAVDYYRELNIRDAISTTRFNIGGVTYKREVFASAPGAVIVVRLSCDKPRQINISVGINSLLRSRQNIPGSNELVLSGKAPAHVDPSYVGYNAQPVVYDDTLSCRGMRFELLIKATSEDGIITSDTSGIIVKNASEVLLLISAATSFNGFSKCPDKEGLDEHALATAYLTKAAAINYPTLLQDHLADFHKYFNRVSLTLNPGEKSKAALPTDERLDAYTKGSADAGLEALYFQYGRYLLISSSRTANVPANLQGIWNKELRPPWSSNYTTNINVQMNYWPVEVANLHEMFSPLNGFIQNLAVTGTETAKSYYHAKGWVVHHNSDIWAMSNPVGDLGKGSPMWANWYMGANWLSRHLWEHYQFTGDKQFLRTAYPIMKSAAAFTLDWLVKNNDGYLVTAPSTSPENVFYYDGKKQGDVSIATTMDMGIIRDLFTNIIEAGKVLNTDKVFIDSLAATKKQLYPFYIGAKGQLQEWYKDYEDVDPHHRHTSHLYALHPAHEISPLNTPALAGAAKRTLQLRGDDGTGWSLAWKVNLWARLLDGNHAYTLFKNLLRLTKEDNTNYNKGGGAYANLFDAHPPFQIDGNFAGTAGVAEMLLQSQNQELHLLPALPDAWGSGAVKGLVGRGNFVTGIEWNNGKLSAATILSRMGGICKVRTAQPVIIKELNIRSKQSSIGYELSFNTVKGKIYLVAPVIAAGNKQYAEGKR